MFKKRKDIIHWLRDYYIYDYTITNDLTVNVYGDVNLSYSDVTDYLPVQFGIVTGYFDTEHTSIASMHGFPKIVGLFLDVSFCDLQSLEHMPSKIGTWFDFSHNNIDDIDLLLSSSIGGIIYCERNRIKSFIQFLELNISNESLFDNKHLNEEEFKLYTL